MTLDELNALLDEVGETPCMSAPDLFFPHKERIPTVKYAKQLCSGCPILAECAAYALENREVFGIWGGMTWNDRKKIIRRNYGG